MDTDDYYERQGSGSPIVFIHGSYATTSTWKKMVDRLAEDHHCISIKLPGHCGTPDPKDLLNPSISTEVDLLVGIISRLTDEPVHLVGHSFGGVIALALALDGRIEIAQMTLFEPVSVWVLDRVGDTQAYTTVQDFLSGYFTHVLSKKPYACRQVIDFWGGEGVFETLPEFIKDSMEALVDNNVRHWKMDSTITSTVSDLRALKVPTRLVCGSKSNQVAHAITDHLANEIPVSRKYIIDDASHFLVTSHSDACLSKLLDHSFF